MYLLCLQRFVVFQIGIECPKNTTLRSWKGAVSALSAPAFAAIKEVCEEITTSTVDPGAVSLAYLTRKEFAEMKKTPTKQRLCILLLVRQDKTLVHQYAENIFIPSRALAVYVLCLSWG